MVAHHGIPNPDPHQGQKKPILPKEGHENSKMKIVPRIMKMQRLCHPLVEAEIVLNPDIAATVPVKAVKVLVQVKERQP